MIRILSYLQFWAKCRLTNQCTRIANARFYEGYLQAKKQVIVVTFARPQSRDFKRWAAREVCEFHNLWSISIMNILVVQSLRHKLKHRRERFYDRDEEETFYSTFAYFFRGKLDLPTTTYSR